VSNSEITLNINGNIFIYIFSQIVTWKVLDGSLKLKEEDWGWEQRNSILKPIMTNIDIAPDVLLKVVRQQLSNHS